MSQKINKCKDKLIFISSVKDKKLRYRLLDLLWDKCLYEALKEILINADKGVLKLNKKNLKLIRPSIKAISRKKVNINRLKKQIGGFWHMLIPAALSALSLLK